MDSSHNKSSNLVKQGTILALAAIIVKFIGFIYKIPLQSETFIGNTGYAYYSYGFQVYNVLLIISSYGVPMALSKIISEKNALGKFDEAEQALKVTTMFCITLSVIASIIMWFGSDLIASYFFSSPNTAYTIKALSITLIFVGFLCIFRGYFQGHNNMVPTAISQIIEQIFNAIGGLILAYILVQNSVSLGAAGATLGTTIGALFACVFLVYTFTKYKRKKKQDNISKSQISNRAMLKEILHVLVPITVVAAITSIIALIDSSMYSNGMVSHGLEADYITYMYGTYSGKFILITNFPISIATALAAASIPSIAASIVRKDYNIAQVKMNKILKLTCLITLPASVGLTVLANPILYTIFRGDEGLNIGSRYLQYGSIIVFLFSIFQITNAILQGMHKVKEPVKNMLLAGIIKVLLNYILLYTYNLGAEGLIISSIVFGVVLLILNIRSIYLYSDVRFNWKRILMKPVSASLIMGVICLASYKLLYILFKSIPLACIISIGIGLLSYGTVLILFKGIDRDELALLPYGNKIADILNIK